MVTAKAPAAMKQLVNLICAKQIPVVLDQVLTSDGPYLHVVLLNKDYFGNEEPQVSAICQPGSYGFPDHIEVMIGDDEPEGYLTPEEACQIFIDQWRWINGE